MWFQGQEEAALGIPMSCPSYDFPKELLQRQASFVEAICIPGFEALALLDISGAIEAVKVFI